MPYDYIKVKRSIFTGSLHGEEPATKLLFLAMIFESTEGVLVATVDYLCRMANLSLQQVLTGLDALQQPDPDSTSLASGGRRIELMANTRNTYRIVNFEKYQPSLVNRGTNKLGEVVNPASGQPISRTLPDGRRNPDYDRRHKQLSRSSRQKSLASHSVEESMGDQQPGSVHSVHSVHERKGNERKEKEDNPPISPAQSLSTMDATNSIPKGKPENSESWERFCSVYPKRLNGATLQRMEAREIWDLLAADGEDLDRIVMVAKKYHDWIIDLDKSQYVPMMTNWLNKRRWEDSYDIDPNSEDGKRLHAKKEAELREQRSAHEAMFSGAYENYVVDLAENRISDPGFVQSWRAEAAATLASREKMGIEGGTRMARRVLEEPEAAREGQLRKWKRDNQHIIPEFWEWDRDHNLNRFE